MRLLHPKKGKTNARDWSVQLGLFKQASEAHKTASSVHKNFKIKPSKVSVSQHPKYKQKRFRSRITRLTEDESRRICVFLKNKGTQCALIDPTLKAFRTAQK